MNRRSGIVVAFRPAPALTKPSTLESEYSLWTMIPSWNHFRPPRRASLIMRHLSTLPCLFALLSFLVASLSQLPSGAQSTRPAFERIDEDPKLPRVLLLGDSISIGYTVDVREQLDGVANVIRPGTNCGPTTRGVANIEEWLGDGKWDVIHFNFGLHDLKYVGKGGDALVPVDAPGSRQQVPLEQYTANLKQIVERLEKTRATLIWCSTTPVPEGAVGRVPGDAGKYNAAARQVMQEAGIEINDLYAVAKPKLSEIQRPANVHFTDAGSAYLAKHVAASIRKALEK